MTQYYYIGVVYNKTKPGISEKLFGRLKQYSKGNHNPIFYELYVSKPGYDEHVENCERFVKGVLDPYFEKPNGKSSEYVDPKYDHIDTQYVRGLVEERIKCHPLKMYRLKKTFLPVTRYNAKTIEEGIKNFPEKYLEEV